jgi:hypothetical protein
VDSITTEEAYEILWGHGEAVGFPHVAIQLVSEHRWHDRELVVFARDDKLYGFYHDRPATEEQEGMDEFDDDPVPVFPVTQKQISTTIYEVQDA